MSEIKCIFCGTKLAGPAVEQQENINALCDKCLNSWDKAERIKIDRIAHYQNRIKDCPEQCNL